MKSWYLSKKIWIAVIALIGTIVAVLTGNDEIGKAIVALGATLIGAIGLQDWGKAAKAGAGVLLVGVLLFGVEACGLVTPGAKSPCDGLYCLTIVVAGVPGTGLICYETQAELAQAKTRLQAQGVTVR